MDEPEKTVRSIAAGIFPALALSLDDRLETDLELVLGYRHRIDPPVLERAVKAGLGAFPHLTGRLVRDGDDGQWWIVPASDPTDIELVDHGGPAVIADLHGMSVSELALRFLPANSSRLFALRWTRCAGGDVIGLRVSHAAVDGTGLGRFARCCAAGARGQAPPKVNHDRREILTTSGDDTGDTPPGYRDMGRRSADWQWPSDPWAADEPMIFAIPAAAVRRVMDADGSLLDQRLALAGWLCQRLAEIAPQMNEIAVWCDPRGGGLLPRHFTGNAGCYLALPLGGQSPLEITAGLKHLAGRRGLLRTTETYRRIKCAEAAGRMVVWDGPRETILQLNLLPRAVADADFGGAPDFSMLLSRNSSGLRISITPDGVGFLIEASLAQGWGKALVEEARTSGLDPKALHSGNNPKPGI
jgi:hypothetical protein